MATISTFGTLCSMASVATATAISATFYAMTPIPTTATFRPPPTIATATAITASHPVAARAARLTG